MFTLLSRLGSLNSRSQHPLTRLSLALAGMLARQAATTCHNSVTAAATGATWRERGALPGHSPDSHTGPSLFRVGCRKATFTSVLANDFRFRDALIRLRISRRRSPRTIG